MGVSVRGGVGHVFFDMDGVWGWTGDTVKDFTMSGNSRVQR